MSSAGGADNAPLNACRIGAACFALFLKSQRQWTGPPLSEDTISRFPLLCGPPPSSSHATPADGKGYDFDRLEHVVPHGCYLVNLANPDQEKWAKAHAAFVEELLRAETLGIGKFNFHPGSTTGACSREEGIEWIAKGINEAHKQTKSVKILIENMVRTPLQSPRGLMLTRGAGWQGQHDRGHLRGPARHHRPRRRQVARRRLPRHLPRLRLGLRPPHQGRLRVDDAPVRGRRRVRLLGRGPRQRQQGRLGEPSRPPREHRARQARSVPPFTRPAPVR